MKLLLVGASGLVGSHVLQRALVDERVSEVVAPSRCVLISHPKLTVPLIDFDNLPTDAPWWQVDAVICTLGTTMKRAGSQAAFRRVDHAYPLAVAKRVRQQGAPTYVLNSAVGADVESRFFYNRVKGELERDLAACGFDSLTLVRPGLISGLRQEFRAGERAAECVLKLLGPLLPRRMRVNPADSIARALLEAAIEARAGVNTVDSAALV